jgi:hypothetical protein
MCYTKTKDENSNQISNPCYACHINGKEPNYINDSSLQLEYNFPKEIMKNPFANLFKDRTKAVEAISDSEILDYVRKSNYFDQEENIILASSLPKDWRGYRPDCYYNFDDEGFDRDPNGNYTLWRAFRYYPFLGTFWATNGSMDDVLIRLDKAFSQDSNGTFDKEIYKLNLAIVEAVVKGKDVNLSKAVDESKYGVDLNQNGVLDTASKVAVASYDKMSYVGEAKRLLEEKKVHLALGLFPENTEFLHSVRYLDWDSSSNHVKMAKRIKELRYAKKYEWNSYSQIKRTQDAEFWEAQTNQSDEINIETWYGNYEDGLKTGTGWIYQGFIEAKNGALRPQTHEETIGCMGCHAGIGATTDTTFSFARKFEGVDKKSIDYGWNHWNQKGLVGVAEPKATYKKFGKKYEYSFYLQNNHSGNEFRDNDEVKDKFFEKNATVKNEMIEKLHSDISLLLFPSKSRALNLNKGYKAMVAEQSYIYGRDANVKPMVNVYKEIEEGQKTDLKSISIER